MNAFAAIDPRNVQQEELFVEVLGDFVVAEDLLTEHGRTRASGQGEQCGQVAA